jgi:excisionase family DNA binding protein
MHSTETAEIRRILYRPAEAAELLGISRSQAYSLIAQGVIESVKLGSSIRIPARALDRLAAGQTQKK